MAKEVKNNVKVKKEIKVEQVVTANQYAETVEVRRLTEFLKKKYGKTTKTLKDWSEIFKAEKYI